MPRIEPLTQQWFEMSDQSTFHLDQTAWIPLRSFNSILRTSAYPEMGYVEEFFAAVSLIVPSHARTQAESLSWMDVNTSYCGPAFAKSGEYIPSGQLQVDDSGMYFALAAPFCHIDAIRRAEWYLSQDIEIALSLLREGDDWYRPDDDYVKVALLQRNDEGKPQSLEIRAQYIKDYLCARNCGLLVSTYRFRRGVLQEDPGFGWGSGGERRTLGGGDWQGRLSRISASGEPAGSRTAVFLVARTDHPSEGEDSPVLPPPGNDNFATRLAYIEHPGPGRFVVNGELWRNEWVEPGSSSPIVRGDDNPQPIFFVIDPTGIKVPAPQLARDIRWLFFEPTVVEEILNHRGGYLNWSTANTGIIGLASGGVQFGVNDLGFINVLAKDVADLPTHSQQLWAARNATPEGGVCSELYAQQMEARFLGTKAPEVALRETTETLDEVFLSRFGSPLFETHQEQDAIFARCHRFRALSDYGTRELAKDVGRVIIERMSLGVLKNLTSTEPSDWKSIKRMEALLSAHGADGRRLTAPLVGVNDLRQADAHLPSSEWRSSFELMDIHSFEPGVALGFALLRSVVVCLSAIAQSLSITSSSQTP